MVKWKKAYLIQTYCSRVIIVILLYCGPSVGIMSQREPRGDSHSEIAIANLGFLRVGVSYCLLFIWIPNRKDFSTNNTPVWLLYVVWLKEINRLEFSVQKCSSSENLFFKFPETKWLRFRYIIYDVGAKKTNKKEILLFYETIWK